METNPVDEFAKVLTAGLTVLNEHFEKMSYGSIEWQETFQVLKDAGSLKRDIEWTLSLTREDDCNA